MTDLSASPAGISDAALLAALHSEILRADWPAESIARLLALPGAFALVATQRVDETPVDEAPVDETPVGESSNPPACNIRAVQVLQVLKRWNEPLAS